MSGRAVGGAAGAGCGAFTFVSVLMGVALTVWLGSQVIGGDGGGGGKTGNEVIDGNNEIAKEALDGIMEAPGSGTAPPEGSVEVVLVPETGYAPDSWIKVAGSGFTKEAKVQLVTCAAGKVPKAQGDASACDWQTDLVATAAADGMLLSDYKVNGTISVDGEPLDCAATAGACEVLVAPPGSPSWGDTVPLTFGTG